MAKGPGHPAGSHIIITQHTPPRRILLHPGSTVTRTHGTLHATDRQAKAAKQHLYSTVLISCCGTVNLYRDTTQVHSLHYMAHRCHAIGSESPQSRDRQNKSGVPAPAPMSLLHAQAQCPRTWRLSVMAHGPLPLAGRLSCQSLRRNAVRGGLGDFICSPSGHPILYKTMGTAPLASSGTLSESHSNSACCVQLSFTSRVQSCRTSMCCGEIAFPQAWNNPKPHGRATTPLARA
jgi:hypothetical protein